MYKKEREAKMSQLMQANGPMWQIDGDDHDIEPVTNATNGVSNGNVVAKAVPSVGDVIGAALKHVGPYKQLDNTKQVVALIDDVSCSALILLSPERFGCAKCENMP